MIADLGIVVPRSVRTKLLSELPRETRTWGEETFVVGELYHCYPGLESVKLQVFPLGKFIARFLPNSWGDLDLEYVGLGGAGKSDYLKWVDFDRGPEVEHVFEQGLKSLLKEAGTCALTLVPDDEALEMIGTTDLNSLPQILRAHLLNAGRSPGFVALFN